jgi:transglutaminase-like putative cysteine protease
MLGAIPYLARRAARTGALPMTQAIAAHVERLSPRERARVLLEWLHERVRFEPDPNEWTEGDLYQSPRSTWQARRGDCDDTAPLLAAMLRAAGLRSRLVAMSSEKYGWQPRHVSVQAYLPCCETCRAGCWDWVWCEPTIRGARVGEHPAAAALRTRASSVRGDLR